MNNVENFGKIAAYLTHPLVLAGFAILCFFAIHRLLIESGILPPVSQSQSSTIVKVLLQYGYIVALVTILGGFALKFWQEYTRRPQAPRYSSEHMIVGSQVGTVVYNKGDPPEVRQQKIEQAKDIVRKEISSNFSAIDARLAYVDESVRPDEIERSLNQAMRQAVPSASEAIDGGYKKLMAEASISSLRQAMNGTPLRSSFSTPLVQVLIEAGIDVGPVRSFYDQLAEVEWATESLFGAVAEHAKESEGAGPAWQDKTGQRIAIDTLRQRSALAYLVGLDALHVLGAIPSDVNRQLAGLHHLKPTYLPDRKTLAELMNANLADAEQNVARKKSLQEVRKQLLEDQTRNAGPDIENRLTIRPTDTWNEVVGKAISLRQFGRIADSMAGFSTYGRMFGPTDLTAEQYARTAQSFTQQINALALKGGVYLFQTQGKGAAKAAGMQAGDIVVEYDGTAIHGMAEMTTALSASKEGEIKRVTYLRLEPDTGRFQRHTRPIEGGPLGAGMMPI